MAKVHLNLVQSLFACTVRFNLEENIGRNNFFSVCFKRIEFFIVFNFNLKNNLKNQSAR